MILKTASIILFLILCGIGALLSLHKPLWYDELYGQLSSVEQHSYAQLILGDLQGEGNNCPLFFLVQKGFTNLIHYRAPFLWNNEFSIYEPKSQIILRFMPFVFLSLGIVLIFYFFSRYYSLWAGIYALLLSLASPLVWAYWAEARPYSLWFLLSVIQSLLLIKLLRDQDQKALKWLIPTHFLLALTTLFGILQIISAAILLWIFDKRHWKQHLCLTFLPMIIAGFYSLQAFLQPDKTHIIYFFFHPWWMLLMSNFPLERLGGLVIYIAIVLYAQIKRISLAQQNMEGKSYLLFFFLMIIAAAMIMSWFTLHSTSQPTSFPVPNRYFIFLTPVGIIISTLILIDIVKWMQGKRWILANILIIVLGTLLVQGFHAIDDLLKMDIYY